MIIFWPTTASGTSWGLPYINPFGVHFSTLEAVDPEGHPKQMYSCNGCGVIWEYPDTHTRSACEHEQGVKRNLIKQQQLEFLKMDKERRGSNPIPRRFGRKRGSAA